MHYEALKERAAFQSGGDVEELPDLEPYAGQYVNEGYRRLVMLLGGDPPLPLELNEDEPTLPAWMHPAIADFATWMLLRNGNPQRQARGVQYRAAFEETVATALRGTRRHFIGLYGTSEE
ncbi:MAG: hypothetical protein LBM74_08770 [Oscillospiraceae bacterium]|jgi:hypothetical protein|nr:hypothetical protein [Oscillospiraceae bacterium]